MEWLGKLVGGAIAIVILFFVVGALFAFPVMWIWNWLIPQLFPALPQELDFWQSFWLVILCSLLFKGGSSSSSS
jgi:hypothetical protein